MTTSDVFKKLFKRRSKNGSGGSKATAPSITLNSPGLESTTPPALAQPQKISPLLSLPGELRIQIYKHAIYPSLSQISVFKHVDPVFCDSIFHICRQVRREALAYLCGQKDIYLNSLRVASEFLGKLCDAVESLSSVVIQYDLGRGGTGEERARVGEEVLGYLERARGLKGLALVVRGFQLSAQDGGPRWALQSVGTALVEEYRVVVDDEKGVQEEGELRKRFLDALNWIENDATGSTNSQIHIT